jgi:phospholipid transport system substrate-binding protein
MRNILFLNVILWFSWLAPATAADSMMAPDALAKSVTEEVLAIIRADKDIQAGNQKKVLELVETKIVPHFNFAGMTRIALGKNWSQANAEQRKALTNEFRALLIRTYTTAFTQYKNQTVEYRALRLAPGDNDVVVKSFIKQPSGQPIAVDYNMEKTDAGWKVYNLKIEGISLVENYRNTFNTEIQKSGIDGLIKTLADRNKSLAQSQVVQK